MIGIGRADLEFGNKAQSGEQLVLWFANMGLFDFGPGRFKLPSQLAQALAISSSFDSK